jgi:hypothetical protein
MKFFLVSLLIVIGCVSNAGSLKPETKAPSPFVFPSVGPEEKPSAIFTLKTNSLSLNFPPTRNLTISTGSGGNIVISLETGRVTLPPGLKNDRAAVEFWRAVTEAFPVVREKLRQAP